MKINLRSTTSINIILFCLAIVVGYLLVVLPMKNEITVLKQSQEPTIKDIAAALSSTSLPPILNKLDDIRPAMITMSPERIEKRDLNDSTFVNVHYKLAQIFFLQDNKIRQLNNQPVIFKQDTVSSK